jgi:hypothetical protein
MSGPAKAGGGAIRQWWATPVLTRLYRPAESQAFGPAQGTAGFRDWLQKCAKDVLSDVSQPGDKIPSLAMLIGDYALTPSGAVPRRAVGAVLAGVFCMDAGPNTSTELTFLDPRGAADMVPGSSRPPDPALSLDLPANGLVLFPAWVPQGHTAVEPGRGPHWLKLRFRPAAFAAMGLD